MNHGLDRRVEVNARASLVIGDLIKNAIKVNEVNSLSQGHEGDYVLLSCFSDETGVYGVSIYVDRVSNEITGMDSIDILYSVNGKKIGTAAPNAEVSDRSPSPTVPTISISQLLEKSNTKFKDIFSKDVYEHFGTEKDTSTKLGATTRYSLPLSEIDEILADTGLSEQDLIDGVVNSQNPDIRHSLLSQNSPTSYTEGLENYTEKEYNNFGWVRYNDIVSSGRWRDFNSKFADAISGKATFVKTEANEYIVPVNDLTSDGFGIDNVLIYAKGTLEHPIITKVVK